MAGGGGLRAQRRFDVGQGRGAVDAGFPATELPQIGAVQQQKPGHRRHTMCNRWPGVYPVFGAIGATIRAFGATTPLDAFGDLAAGLVDGYAPGGEVVVDRAEYLEVLGVQLARVDAEDAAIGGREDREW